MKTVFAILSVLPAGAAYAHESLVPHQHPHPISMLPGVDLIGVAALALALAVIAITHFKSR